MLNGGSTVSASLRNFLNADLSSVPDTIPRGVVNDGPCILGIGVMQALRFVCGDFRSPDAHRLAQATVTLHKRRQCPKFLEHAVLAAAFFPHEMSNDMSFPSDGRVGDLLRGKLQGTPLHVVSGPFAGGLANDIQLVLG